MRALLTVIISLFVASSAWAQSRPNILLIIADDMGVDVSPCHSVKGTNATMPNLKARCNSGMVFENAYASPTCSPTRASIMTGKIGSRTGITGAISPRNSNGLSSNETSLFDIVGASSAGYSSAVIGKWHLAPQGGSKNHPKSLGVPNYFGLYSGGTKDYFNWTAVSNGSTQQQNRYSTSVFADKAVEFIAQQSAPWFLWLAFNAPHTPFHAPPDALISGSLSGTKKDIRRNKGKYYRAALQALDTEMGRVLATIPSSERDNTIVIFIGDNGTPSQVAKSVWGNNGAKGSIYEGGTHVPLVVSGRGVSKGRTKALVSATDLFSTIANLASSPAKAKDSVDFSTVLAGKAGTREYIYVEHDGAGSPKGLGSYGCAIRDQQFKLVFEKSASPKLFDLNKDPYEKRDLLVGSSGSFEEVVQRLLSAKERLTK
jgi:arylsulfatase A-like enzyme